MKFKLKKKISGFYLGPSEHWHLTVLNAVQHGDDDETIIKEWKGAYNNNIVLLKKHIKESREYTGRSSK